MKSFRATRARHRGLLLAAFIAAIAAASVFLLPGAQVAGAALTCDTASHLNGSKFEIDTDANLKVDDPDCIDWLADGSGSAFRPGVFHKADKPTGTTDDSFGQGSKENDTDPTIIDGSIPNNKSDLTNFGLYAEPSATIADSYLELFWTRVQSPQGTTNMDFELNQKFCDPNANPTNCSANGVTPLRTVGDKLITYDLANGGTVPTISIRNWNGSSWDAPTDLSASGGAIGSINSSTIAAADSGGLGALDELTFGEAAISFKQIFTNPAQCGTIGSVYVKSRSSDSFQAEIKDFIAPEQVNINTCPVVTTTATAGPVVVGSAIHDTAHLSGGFGTLTGTIAFKVYAPGDTTCATPTAVTPDVTVNGAGDYQSADFTTSAVGTYRWRAFYSGDANNPSASTACNDANESSTIIKASPGLTTTATAGPVVVGGNIHDVAHLTGGFGTLSGTITFQVFAPGDTTCQTPTAVPPAKTVNGVGDYTSGDFATSAVGTYRWIAHYSGDANNNGFDTACNDANESSTTIKATPTLTTTASGPVIVGQNIHDVAHLAGGFGTLGGSVTFQVFAPGDPTCQTPIAVPPSKTVNGAGDYQSGDFATSAVGTYRWIAHYSGDANNNAVDTACNDANESSTVNKATPTLSTDASGPVLVGANIHDVAHLAGGFGTLGGSVTFQVFAPGDTTCQTPTAVPPAKTVNGAGDYTSGDFATSQTGVYRWRAFYSGDANNNAVSTPCNDAGESSGVGLETPTLTTTASGPVIVGSKIHDTAHLSGGFAPQGGTIAFKVYAPGDTTCANPTSVTPDVSVSGAGDYLSADFTTSQTGVYRWRAFYSGDANNNPVSTPCNDANESSTVNPATPTLTTTASGPVVVGSNIHDTAHLSGGFAPLGGSIAFKVYAPGDTTCQTPTSVTPDVSVSGAGDYVSADFATSKAGVYRWRAFYSGDANNNAVSTPCNDANESSTVNKASPSLTTDAGGPFRLGEDGTVGLTDTAHLSGGTADATGTISFTLYGPDPTPNDNSEDDCTEGNIVGQASATVDKGADGEDYTSGPPISVDEPGAYHWVAHYGGDANNEVADSTCGAEGENPLVIAPHITVVKSPDEQVIRSGDSVSWTIEVINDGSSTLTDVKVTDELAPGCARTSADIPGLASMPPAPAAGSDITYICTRDNNTLSFTNVAVATGTPEVGDDVSSEDSAHVTVIHPAITVSKTPHTQTVAFAGTVTFTIGVKNTGDSVLTDVHVTDAQAPGCARTKADIPQLASMAPGDELSYSCTVANVMANFTNVATAIGTPEKGPDVSSTDSAAVTVGPPPPPVTHPAISIVKNPKSQTVTTGGTATFTITVTNTGDVALTNVKVDDPKSPNCNRTIGTLAPGQSVSYTCTRPNVQASFDNVAVATGTAGDKTVTAQDTAPVTAKAPFKPKPVPKVVSHKKPKTTG